MPDAHQQPRPPTAHDRLVLGTPRLWEHWPFLPVVRHRVDGEMDYGVLYDCWTVSRRSGYSATVFLTNLFLLPSTEEKLLALPKETFDTVEELVAAGWRVD
jgi:hypothetical protein